MNISMSWIGARLRAVLRGSFGSALCLAVLVACGGGGGGVGEGGTGTVSAGPITGFGSVVVGGVTFDDRAAIVEGEDDDDTPSLSSLQQGMVVSVESGDIQQDADGTRRAQAQRIRVAGSLLGPVSDVQLLRRTLRVLGLRVRYNASTYFDPSLREGLRLGVPLVGQVVEVWGYVDPDLPGFVATAVKPRPNAALYKARGVVRKVEGAEVEIGDERFDFSALPDRPSVGQLVRLRADAGGAAGPWKVRHWREIGAHLGASEGGRIELEGVVSAVTDAQHFSVNGVPVQTDAAVGGLAIGVYVEAQGRWRAGVLVAESVKLESEQVLDQRENQWEGTSSAHVAASRSFTLTTSAGRSVGVVYDASTEFKDGSAADLGGPRQVEVRGTWNGESLQATRIRLR